MHGSIADFLLDIVQNSWEAASSRIDLELRQDGEMLRCRVQDNGRGMAPEQIARALDPFYTDGVKHPGRRVGLGLPFLKQTMEDLGSTLVLTSVQGQGTNLEFGFPLGNIDCPPLGDLAGTLGILLAFDGSYELLVEVSGIGGDWSLSRTELLEALGNFDTVGSRVLLREYIESMMEDDHGQDEPR